MYHGGNLYSGPTENPVLLLLNLYRGREKDHVFYRDGDLVLSITFSEVFLGLYRQSVKYFGTQRTVG